MAQIISAIYDGTVLKPETQIDLQPNTRVRVTIEVLTEENAPGSSFLDTALAMNLSGPPDWAANIDKYLYGNGNRPE